MNGYERASQEVETILDDCKESHVSHPHAVAVGRLEIKLGAAYHEIDRLKETLRDMHFRR